MKNSKELSKSYEIFILVLSILSIFNIFLYYFPLNEASKTVVLTIDSILCLIFLGDFSYRLHNATSKRKYFINEKGWLDLLGSIPVPGLRFARFFRIFRSVTIMREYGIKNMRDAIMKDKASSALYVVVFFIMLVLEFGSIAVLQVEARSPDANIVNASDALWWNYATITTVGYGDRYPVTNAGRIVGIFVLTTGVGLFGVLTGFLANTFLEPKEEESEPPSENIDNKNSSSDMNNEILKKLNELSKKVEDLSNKK